jgi:hypothetical protein
MVFAVSASLITATSIHPNVAWSGALTGVSAKAQENGKDVSTPACPGCDADVRPGSCSGAVSDGMSAADVQIPYGVGAARYRSFSGIGNANRSLERSMRNLNDSIRRMDTTINRIRNINRRF